jgi:hypothetical protein
MYRRLVVSVAVLVTFVVTPEAMAQVSQASLARLEAGCDTKKEIQRTFSSDGKIRAEYITYCEGKNGETVLWFEAGAMEMESFRGNSQAPWMHVELIDRSGRVIYKKLDAWLVEVATCGGYEFHFHRLPSDVAGKVDDVRVWMGGTNGRSCSPHSNPVTDILSNAIAIVSGAGECNASGLGSTVSAICKFLKGTMF